MAFFKSIPAHVGPPHVYMQYPEIYGPWSSMSEALMNGPSSLNQGERELIFAYSAGLARCEMVYVAHSEVAYAWGIENGLVDPLLKDLDTAPVEDRLKPLLAFVRKLTLTPSEISQTDADAVFDAGWDEKALHDAIAVTGRAKFMVCIAQGFGFKPMSREKAALRAKERVEKGYVNLYPVFQEKQ
ncbi:peroxidase [Pollutimonas nitritireducens]|uniref:Peroxidase n=1 Tax=Pollutimonas nitritireducens TaxID=2045209 RepID=A0A2N4ULK3_9BURK|nr:peroxidase [Pollutimonas nitritireducens]PLC55904.1 peroxidase [Pollutimonas nitritireducens]